MSVRLPLLQRAAPAVVGMAIGVVILALLVVPPIAVPEFIVELFLKPTDPGFEAVSKLATALLAVVAIFQVFDALQAIAVRALRAFKDTLVPMWLAGLGYWVFGIGGGCLLAYPLMWGPAGLWWGMALGLIFTGSLLAWRFLRLAAARAATISGAP